MVADGHRALGGPEGAGPRRRPPPHRGGQGAPAALETRSESTSGVAVGTGRPSGARSSAALSGSRALRRASLSGFVTDADADDGPVHDVEHEGRHDGVPVHEDRGRLAVEHGRPAGTPCNFLATLSRNRELRYGPTTGRMAARTLPPPSVQTTTSSESIDRRPERSPVAQATRKRSVSARPWRRSASKRWRRSSTRLRARAPSCRQAAGDRPSERATSSKE